MRTALRERADEARAPALCAVCNTRPRAGSGLLTRCTSCIKAAAAVDRLARERRKAEFESRAAAASATTTKACRTCGKAKALDLFAKHRLSRDGHRHDCKACVTADRAKRSSELNESQRAVDKARRAQPHRRASNRRAVHCWTQRNPEAVRARRRLRQAVKAGEIRPAKVCEVKGCSSSRRIEGHHADYRRWREVAWLCAKHHRRAHSSGRPVKLKSRARQRLARLPKLN